MTTDEARKLWIEALRSGKYEQGRTRLLRDGKYCCLGVACDLFCTGPRVHKMGSTYFEEDYYAVLPPKVTKLLGLRSSLGTLITGGDLTILNDNGKSFQEIADVLESGAAWRETQEVD